MSSRILIVDDDEKLRKLLKEYLEGYGLKVITLADGLNIEKVVRAEDPDAVILDIMLPGEDGLSVLKRIRSFSSVPVIMLTAKGEDSDRIVGLELGADDYMPKPFNPRELLARIKAVLRRLRPERGAPEAGPDAIKAGGLALQLSRQALLVEEHEIELSTAECRVMEALMRRPNVALSRDRLMTLARGRDFMAFDRSIDMHISNLRSKLSAYPDAKKRIKTIWGTGYMFVVES
jgi:two-component system, OmpR family, phosphate regulon response regulator OmpR